MRALLLGTVVLSALMVGHPAAQAAPKTLVYCSEGSPENFNAALNTTGTTFDANRPIAEGLVAFERGKTNVQPALAERWEVSDDGLTYTFHLRRGVKWHSNKDFKPSRDFNADDVVFSFHRQWKPEHPYYPVSGGGYAYFKSQGLADLLESVEKVDDHTVVFRLKHPETPFVATLGMDFANIQSAEYADFLAKKGAKERIDQDPIGTGPFFLQVYQKDAQVRYRAFPDYWGGKAALDSLVFSITPDAAVRYAKLQRGECHLMPYPNPPDLAAMKADPAINLLQQEGLNIGYMALNTQKKPFDDVRVRRAINMAIDRQAIIDNVFQGSGVVAKNPIPPTIWSYNEQVQDYEFDPEKAKALLAEAGFPDGFQTDLYAMPVQRPYNPNARRMAELIQADLAKIGVKADIVSFEWGEYRKRIQNGDHGMALFGWTGDNGDPDNFMHTLLGCAGAVPGGSNIAKWCHKPYDDLVTEAKRVPDQAERAKLYAEAQRIFKEEAPWVTIAHSIVFEPVRKEVVDYKQSPFNRHEFYGVDLKQ
ncbi:ABC transporter substrate-binding protein [Indioceanicola profundi]|uniref:ABC transporter substrate-binding protein n=1 Tax=Indioceanicola profundi TaxID=2220096 RepID=UPI000E6AAE3F|nr:ABC transporter substrate-binding protein [Indioceanicola profundi]